MLDLGFKEDHLEFILEAAAPQHAAPSCSPPPSPRTSPPWRATIRTMRSGSTPPGPASRTATSSTAPCASRPTKSSMPWSMCCASPRPRGSASGVLLHPRGGASPPQRRPARAGLRRGQPLGRDDPARAHGRPAGAAGRPGAGVRGHRRGGAGPRSARSGPGDPRRPARQPPGPAAPQRPHRTGRTQGRPSRCCWSPTPAGARARHG